MLIYQNTKGGFISDVRDNLIAYKVEDAFRKHNISHNNEAEFRSWANSLNYMRNVLDDSDISDDCNLAIEYQIPLTSKRVDFLIAGVDQNENNNIVVVELKQWETSNKTSRPDIVSAFTGGANRAVTHPSYQAYSYAKIIESFNEDVYKENIKLYPCAYLHNYKEENRDNIDCDLYKEAIELAPIFLAKDTAKLRQFIKTYIRKKDNIDLLMKIENGKLKPSKALQDSLASMLAGNKEFVLIDEQKVAYETVRKLVHKSIKKSNKTDNDLQKYTVIVQGGPGTGKSIISIQLLCDLIKAGYSANYITKNSAPREIYFSKLKSNNYKLNYIKSLFRGSGSYIDTPNNYFDCLIADEAHRLEMKSGMYKNKGEAQIKEIIHASKVSVFFIDENQVVTTSDVGSVDLILKYAKEENSAVYFGEDLNLVSQFRCNGSDGYLAFIDNMLEIRPTANYLFDIDYDIKIYDNPTKLKEDLKIKNDVTNKSRLLAGYCYDWITKKDYNSSNYDIVLEGNFKAKWNFSNTKTWAIDPNSFDQIGCIHTSQGIEFEYCGVIIGKDLVYKDGHVVTDYKSRAKTDSSLKGIKTSKNYALADRIIRNTYRTLLTRGQKGCFVYCEDKALAKYIAKMVGVDIIK